MANKRISKDKRALAIALLAEGNTINGISRMLKIGKHALLRFLNEVGEACEDWHDKNVVDLSIEVLECDEQWAFCHTHKERMSKEEKKLNPKKGDCWLWASIDRSSKMIVSWRTGKRDNRTANDFISDLAKRVMGEVQINTDQLKAYEFSIRGIFGDRAHHATETKTFHKLPVPGHEYVKFRSSKLLGTERKRMSGNPDLEKGTTSHIERFFLTVRQGNKRSARKTLAYSKDWDNHALVTSIHIFIYNMIRKHETLKTAPAVKLGIIKNPWTLERVVAMTDEYLERKENEMFEAAFEAQFSTEPKPRLSFERQEPKTPWYLDPESGGRNPEIKKPGVNYPGESELS